MPVTSGGFSLVPLSPAADRSIPVTLEKETPIKLLALATLSNLTGELSCYPRVIKPSVDIRLQ